VVQNVGHICYGPRPGLVWCGVATGTASVTQDGSDRGNPVQSGGNYVYRQVEYSAILRSAHTVYLCVLCGSENKQQLLPYTALTDWFL